MEGKEHTCSSNLVCNLRCNSVQRSQSQSCIIISSSAVDILAVQVHPFLPCIFRTHHRTSGGRRTAMRSQRTWWRGGGRHRPRATGLPTLQTFAANAKSTRTLPQHWGRRADSGRSLQAQERPGPQARADIEKPSKRSISLRRRKSAQSPNYRMLQNALMSENRSEAVIRGWLSVSVRMMDGMDLHVITDA